MLLFLLLEVLAPGQNNSLNQGVGRFPLWPQGAPMAQGKDESDTPTITVWQAPTTGKSPRPAVVICPGGGYGGLATGHEGKDPAEFLTKLGVQAFILRYRHAPKYKHPVPMGDCQRAVQWVRAHAMEYQVDPTKVGVWGFSAGGHLVSTVSTRFLTGNPSSQDPVERQSSRPDFSILCYPVITMEPPHTHMGSRKNLLGENPDPELVKKLSNHLQVGKETPPTFVFHTRADQAVVLKNSELYTDALKQAGVDHEFLVYENGAHGVGLGGKDPVLSQWPAKLAAWLQTRGFAPQ